MRVIRPGEDVLQIEVRLRGVVPTVWRVFQIPAAAGLRHLHDVLQEVLGWTNSHLHEFRLDGRRFGRPDPDPEWAEDRLEDDAAVRLDEVLREGTRLVYLYDFGDHWLHDLTARQVMPAESGVRYPRCLDGARACPPEDVGGEGGYEEFLAALGDPTHPEHEQWTRWGEGHDPARFAVAEVNRRLRRLAWHTAEPRPAGPRRASPPDSPVDDAAATLVLRCTGKLLDVLKTARKNIVEAPPAPEDWYANLLWIDGRKCVLFTHAGTLFSVFLPDVRAADLRPIGDAFLPVLRDELLREGLPVDTFGPLEGTGIQLARTADRSVLGSMNDLADLCHWTIGESGGLSQLDPARLHHQMHRHLSGVRGADAMDLVHRRLGLDPPTRRRGFGPLE